MSSEIIAALQAFESPNVFNPWRDVDPLDLNRHAAVARSMRLQAHFGAVPRYLLVGEAPGYQGCHFSGIPFTNEALLADGSIPRVGAIGRITSRAKPWREPSATIMWKALYEAGIAEDTVMWNAFAFHPHKPGEPMSNRAPTRAELLANKTILEMVLGLFMGARVVPVGNVAAEALKACGVPYARKLRHPSMGGANEFRAGLAELVAT